MPKKNERTVGGPQTLQEAVIYFADGDNGLSYLVALRWPDGVTCPTCGSKDVTFLKNQRRWKCRVDHERRQFSVKAGTLMEDSAIPLSKWLPAMWMITNAKNGVSSYEIGRALDVTQKTAWFMLHRLHLAMQDSDPGKLSGQVEADETYIGGLARNMHKDKKEKKIKGTGGSGKTTVTGSQLKIAKPNGWGSLVCLKSGTKIEVFSLAPSCAAFSLPSSTPLPAF